MPHRPSLIRLLSLDFDGTILDYPDDGPVLHPVIVDLLNALNLRGVAWVANSGRSLAEQKMIVEASTHMGLSHLPQAFLCHETLIYECSGPAVRSSEPWNTDMNVILLELHVRVRRALEPRLDEIRERFTKEIFIADLYSAFQFQDAEQSEAFAAVLRSWLREVPGAAITRNGPWVAVISDRAGKGNVLRAYAARAGYDFDEILAVGDHYNDITMLNGTAAAHVGCPADAIDEVKDAVMVAGGYVAEGEGPVGTAEVIRRYIFQPA